MKRPRLFWWTRTGVVLAVIVMANACASIAPMRDVRPEPDFISAAVQPEDKVAVSTVDGRELEFEVASVEADAIVSADGRRVYFRDIDAIAIRSWEEPAHPCGGGTPVGCSVPEVISAASTYHDRYKDVFHKACAEHDYCYRHGHATYGLDQRYCDNRFYGDMMEQCGSAGGGILGLTDVDGLAERAKCRLAADQFYAAVQRYGAKAFRTTGSTYCPFDGADGPR
ncbi:MAG: phospholipase [Chromatiales bacterium]|nr:phospholipase [Chromatiales bacterium]MDH4030444.1 phospholipase [Chromatiales bacterium]